GALRSALVQGILASKEYRKLLLGDLYQQYLHRPIDARGLDKWLNVLQHPAQFAGAGNVVEYVKAQLLGSAEYFTKHGGTNAGFLDGLWRDVLGRPIDAGALATYTGRLARGTTRAAVALAVASSPEARKALVTLYFTRFLHRAADAKGLA